MNLCVPRFSFVRHFQLVKYSQHFINQKNNYSFSASNDALTVDRRRCEEIRMPRRQRLASPTLAII